MKTTNILSYKITRYTVYYTPNFLLNFDTLYPGIAKK